MSLSEALLAKEKLLQFDIFTLHTGHHILYRELDCRYLKTFFLVRKVINFYSLPAYVHTLVDKCGRVELTTY